MGICSFTMDVLPRQDIAAYREPPEAFVLGGLQLVEGDDGICKVGQYGAAHYFHAIGQVSQLQAGHPCRLDASGTKYALAPHIAFVRDGQSVDGYPVIWRKGLSACTVSRSTRPSAASSKTVVTPKSAAVRNIAV